MFGITPKVLPALGSIGGKRCLWELKLKVKWLLLKRPTFISLVEIHTSSIKAQRKYFFSCLACSL